MKRKNLAGLVVLFLLVFANCTGGSETDSGGDPTSSIWWPSSTPTSTVTPSPTVCPTIELPLSPPGTPTIRRTLYLILFDPTEASQIHVAPDEIMPVRAAIEALMQRMVHGGDRIAVFQLGCRYFDYSCRMNNFILPTPKPMGTLVPPSPTPVPTFTPVPSPTLPENWTLFKATEIARAATQTATAVVPTATAIAIKNICASSAWNRLYLEESQNAQATQSAFATQVASMASAEMESSQAAQIPTPYTSEVVFDGLEQISIILNNERNNFDRFVVLIFDSMRDWRVNMETGKVHDLSFGDSIDLQGAEVVMIMPDCLEAYDPPSCKTRSDIWAHLLIERFGAESVVPIPNKQVFEKVMSHLAP